MSLPTLAEEDTRLIAASLVLRKIFINDIFDCLPLPAAPVLLVAGIVDGDVVDDAVCGVGMGGAAGSGFGEDCTGGVVEGAGSGGSGVGVIQRVLSDASVGTSHFRGPSAVSEGCRPHRPRHPACKEKKGGGAKTGRGKRGATTKVRNNENGHRICHQMHLICHQMHDSAQLFGWLVA